MSLVGRCCRCGGGCEPVATVRAFSAVNGAFDWEAENFCVVAMSADYTLWGYQVRKLAAPTFVNRIAFSPGVWAGPIPNDPANRTPVPAKTYDESPFVNPLHVAVDLCKIATDGTRTVTLSDFRQHSVETGTAFTFGISGRKITTSSCPHAWGTQANNTWGIDYFSSATNAGLVIVPAGFEAADIGVIFDAYRIRSTNSRYTIPPQPLVKSTNAGSNVPKWHFYREGVTAEFTLYATASAVELALETLPGVVSATVTGGPVCSEPLVIDIEWENNTDEFQRIDVSYAWRPTSYRPVWDWTAGTLEALVTRTTAQSQQHLSFAATGTDILEGDHPLYRATLAASSAHPWLDRGATVWEAKPFDGMPQTRERTRVTQPFGPAVWGSVPISRRTTSRAGGKILMTSTPCRLGTLDGSVPYYGHAVVNETTGAVETLFKARHGAYVPARLSASAVCGLGAWWRYRPNWDLGVTPYDNLLTIDRNAHGESLLRGTLTADAFDDYQPACDAEGAVAKFWPTASGQMAVENWYISGEASEADDEEAGVYSELSCDTGNSSPTQKIMTSGLLQGYWSQQAAEARFPWGGFKIWHFDLFHTIQSRNPELEWQLVLKLGPGTGGAVVKTTSWFAFGVSPATVQAELDSWYGTYTTGGNTYSKVYFDFFGNSEDNSARSVPAHYRGVQLKMMVDNTVTPNPSQSLVPYYPVLLLRERKRRLPVRRSIAVVQTSDGVVQWQRNAGVPPLSSLSAGWQNPDSIAEAPGELLYGTESRVVVSCYVKPGVDVDVVTGAVEHP